MKDYESAQNGRFSFCFDKSDKRFEKTRPWMGFDNENSSKSCEGFREK